MAPRPVFSPPRAPMAPDGRNEAAVLRAEVEYLEAALNDSRDRLAELEKSAEE